MRWLIHYFQRRAAQRLLGAPLPSDASDLHFVKYRVSSDLAGYDAYIKFRASRPSFLALVRQRGLALSGGGIPSAHLPTAWRLPPGSKAVEWWDAGVDTPADSASGSVGVFGWIVAKHEHGCVYVIISDTGHRKS